MSRPMSARPGTGVVRWGLTVALALALGWAPAPAAAQATGTLVGTVRDAASQRPLEAVQVYIGGSSIGALTNAAGRFLLLNVPAGEVTLVAELVGYRSGSQVITVAGGESVVANFALEQTAIALEQIVVTGAGVATAKKKLGNTIATVDASTLENAPITDFSQMIAGREPGVVALPSSGYTGEGARIRIRGSASLSQLNEPVVYIDGIRMNTAAIDIVNDQGNPSRLDDIPPESIERVEILKGAAAATLYGTEASNGVIQIFTKKGRAGAPRWSFQAELSGVNVPTNRIEPLADFAGASCRNAGCTHADDVGPTGRLQTTLNNMSSRWGRTFDPYEVLVADVVPEILTTGFGQQYTGSVQGGSDLFQYFVSARYIGEDGPLDPAGAVPATTDFSAENDTNRRATITSNFTVIPSQHVRVGVNTLYTDMKHTIFENGNNIYSTWTLMNFQQVRRATEDNWYGSGIFATVRESMLQRNVVNSSHFAGSANVAYTPTDELRLDATFGLDFTSDDRVFFRPYGYNVDVFTTANPTGSRAVSERRSRDITADLKASWIRSFGNFENTFLAGGQGFLSQNQSAGGSGSEFPGPGLETLSALANNTSFETWTRNTQVGGYLQDQLGWDNWVFLTAGGRWDANSAFGENFSTAFYPKASISIVASEGLGWQSDVVSTLRLRAAVGKSGLQPSAFDKFTTYQAQPSEEGPGVSPDNLGNQDLKPEVSTEFEIGTEIGFFQDRASLDVTYWDRTVKDALVDKQFPVSGGFTNSQLVNIGQLEAHGLEITGRGALIQRGGFSLNLVANASYIKETIADLGGAPPIKIGGSYPRYRNWLLEGYAPSAFFGAAPSGLDIPLNILPPAADGSCVIPTREQALDYFNVPRNPSQFKPLLQGNSDFNTPNGSYASGNCGEGALLSYLGKPTPDWQGSFGFDMAFLDNWELSSLFEYKAGNYRVQDLTGEFRRANPTIGRNTPLSAELYATMMNPQSSAEQRLDAAIQWATQIEALSPVDGLNSIRPADWLRLREVSLTYRVPSDFVSSLGLSTATFNLGVRNAFLWVNGEYKGYDPEGNLVGRCNGGVTCNFAEGQEAFALPISRRFTFATRVTF